MRHRRRQERGDRGKGISPWRAALLAACLVVAGSGLRAAAEETAPSGSAPASNAWMTGGGPATAPTPAPGSLPPVAQAWAMPATVIHGGAIPAGWQPQPIPYQGVGADGKPLTLYVAPTYTFTYVAGPPVLAVAAVPSRTQVNRIQAYGSPAVQPAWNYRTQGAPLATTNLPQYVRSAPVAYQYPPGAPALTGQPLAPPSGPGPAPTLVAPPPPQAPLPMPPAPPPTQWVSVPPASSVPGDDALGQSLAGAAPAVMAGTAGAVAAAREPTPAASIAPPPTAAAEPSPPSLPPAPSPAADPPMAPVSAPAASGAAAPPARQGSSHVWRVVGVHDGDTVTCLDETNTQQKVRLAEIDAPELGQDYGKVARESLAELVFGKTVTVQEEGKDRYGRWIGRMQVDGIDVNRRLVATGNAWHYADYSQDPALQTLQEQARAQRLGLWAQPEPVAPWDFRQTVKKAATG